MVLSAHELRLGAPPARPPDPRARVLRGRGEPAGPGARREAGLPLEPRAGPPEARPLRDRLPEELPRTGPRHDLAVPRPRGARTGRRGARADRRVAQRA